VSEAMCKIARRALALKWGLHALSLALAMLSAWLAGVHLLAVFLLISLGAAVGVKMWQWLGQLILEELLEKCAPGDWRLQEAGLAISKKLGREVAVFQCPPDSPLMEDGSAFSMEAGGRAVVAFGEAAHWPEKWFWMAAWHEAAHIRQSDDYRRVFHAGAFYAALAVALAALAYSLSPWAALAAVAALAASLIAGVVSPAAGAAAKAAAYAVALAGVAALPTAERIAAFAAAAAAYAALLKYREYTEIYATLAAAQEAGPSAALSFLDFVEGVFGTRAATYLLKCVGEYFKSSSLMASRRASALLGNTPASTSLSRASKSLWGRWTLIMTILSPLFLGIAAPAPTPRRISRRLTAG